MAVIRENNERIMFSKDSNYMKKENPIKAKRAGMYVLTSYLHGYTTFNVGS